MLAKLNQKRGDQKEEVKHLKEIYKKGTVETFVMTRLSQLLFDSGDVDQALSIAEATLKVDSLNFSALHISGRCHHKLKQFTKALESFLKAAELNSRDFEIWYDLGELCLELDKKIDASVFLDRALALMPNSVAVLLSICEIELKRANIAKFAKFCDVILQLLHLNRNKRIDSLEDIAKSFWK